MVDIEICVETLGQAATAGSQGATRVELCSALDVGGLTPSSALMDHACKLGIDIHVLIRPRPGGFQYSKKEIALMKADMLFAAQKGAKGVVFGALTDRKELDLVNVEELVTFAKSMELACTFHRAIDLSLDPIAIVHQLVKLDFDRILTSGKAPTAHEGIEMIGKMVDAAAGKIEIMAGSGVNRTNADELAKTGVDALHFSIRRQVHSEALQMGNEYEIDLDKILRIREVLKE